MLALPQVRIYDRSEPTAKESVLETRQHNGTNWTLRHKTAGVEPLFRAHKFERESWGAIFIDRNGTRGGRWFATEAEARQQFERWTADEASA